MSVIKGIHVCKTLCYYTQEIKNSINIKCGEGQMYKEYLK
jgi:hypothetical protein